MPLGWFASGEARHRVNADDAPHGADKADQYESGGSKIYHGGFPKFFSGCLASRLPSGLPGRRPDPESLNLERDSIEAGNGRIRPKLHYKRRSRPITLSRPPLAVLEPARVKHRGRDTVPKAALCR